VAAVRARVSLVREVPAGTTVGYGATYAASDRETWATVGIGYGDGLPRLLSNRGHALVKGARVPVIGRISMDVTVVDVTRVPGIVAGDVVTLVGRDGSEEITLAEVAGHARTIDYEILTGLTRRLPRIWRDDDG
jgi:alanine racemase